MVTYIVQVEFMDEKTIFKISLLGGFCFTMDTIMALLLNKGTYFTLFM